MTPLSKNVYIGRSDDILDRCNNIHHGTAKVKPIDVKSKKMIKRTLNLNWGQCKIKYKDIFAKGYVSNCSDEVFVIKYCAVGMLVILRVKEMLTLFMKKCCKNQTEFRDVKVIKREGDNYILNEQVMIILKIVSLIKKGIILNELFSRTTYSQKKMEVKLDLPNYATKYDLQNQIGFGTSDC